MKAIPKYLIIISGQTAVGKSSLCLKLAQEMNTCILSADSRQIYKELNIGTAKPSKEILAQVEHHFVDHISIHEKYSAGRYEREALVLIEELFKRKDCLIVSGGTGFYINAICHGLDDFPDVPKDILEKYESLFEEQGHSALSQKLKEMDPEYFEEVDLNNSRRIIRALSVVETSGKPFSTFKTGKKKERGFVPIFILLDRDRQKLYGRINERVETMFKDGLVEEARSLHQHKGLSSLETVGYKELFEHFDGNHSLAEAKELIKRNTRRYAKRQMTWFRRNPEWQKFHADEYQKIKDYITGILQ